MSCACTTVRATQKGAVQVSRQELLKNDLCIMVRGTQDMSCTYITARGTQTSTVQVSRKELLRDVLCMYHNKSYSEMSCACVTIERTQKVMNFASGISSPV
jgi:hypothetical protein